MKKYLLLMTGFLITNVYAQRTCGTDLKMKEFFEKNPKAIARNADLRNFLKDKKNTRNSISGVVTIPVVVHVLYKNGVQNISDEQILSQIAVLNNDFRKQNTDFDSVVPDVFKLMAADLELAFCMATKDPNGNPTTGIQRKAVPESLSFSNWEYFQGRGVPAWDPTKYLNIWVGAILEEGSLGWAFDPIVAGQPYDGLAIDYRFFGTVGAVQYPYNKGRTATHEIGHYFGLKHIWGEDESACETPGNSDDCDDTPATYNPYYGTPTFPNNQYTCANTANGAMFMNYMDYGDDIALAMFSNDQKVITSNTMIGPRASLLNANGCSLLIENKEAELNSIYVFPNPSSKYISIASPLVKVNEVEIYNSDGILKKKVIIKNETDKINIEDFIPGIYFVRTYNDKQFIKSMKFIKQ